MEMRADARSPDSPPPSPITTPTPRESFMLRRAQRERLDGAMPCPALRATLAFMRAAPHYAAAAAAAALMLLIERRSSIPPPTMLTLLPTPCRPISSADAGDAIRHFSPCRLRDVSPPG